MKIKVVVCSLLYEARLHEADVAIPKYQIISKYKKTQVFLSSAEVLPGTPTVIVNFGQHFVRFVGKKMIVH